MRDLEIRGAGNLLGTGQSGHIAAVGYDLYCQMVTEAVAELKGESRASRPRSSSTCRSTPTCRRDYVDAEELRLEAYRRLAAVTDRRRGRRHPRRVGGPLRAAAAARRGAARRGPPAGRVRPPRHHEVTVSGGAVRFRGLDLPASKQARLTRLAPGSKFGSEETLVPLKAPPEQVADALIALLQELVPPEVAPPEDCPPKIRPTSR